MNRPCIVSAIFSLIIYPALFIIRYIRGYIKLQSDTDPVDSSELDGECDMMQRRDLMGVLEIEVGKNCFCCWLVVVNGFGIELVKLIISLNVIGLKTV